VVNELAHALDPARHFGESFDHYRARRKDAKAEVKKYLRGRMVKAMPRKKLRPGPLPLVTAGKPKSLRIPLHLSLWDNSLDAARKRFSLAADMAALNPDGFRQPGKNGTSLVENRRVDTP